MNGKPIPHYKVPEQHLKEYAMTKEEKKKNKWKIPNEIYLVKEELNSEYKFTLELFGNFIVHYRG